MPLRRIRNLCDHPSKETKHPEPLDEIKTADRRDPDHSSDQRWANEIFLTGCINEQNHTQQRERGLREHSQGKIDKHSPS